MKAKFIDTLPYESVGDEEDEGVTAFAAAPKKMTPDQAPRLCLGDGSQNRGRHQVEGSGLRRFLNGRATGGR